MTKAVIRPDYFSGPAMAEDFGDFGMILQAADAGIVIMDPNVLDPIFKRSGYLLSPSVSAAAASSWVRHQRREAFTPEYFGAESFAPFHLRRST